jgi:CBS domain-containing protein
MAEMQDQVRGSYLTPAFEHATVADAMRAGVISCPPETPLKSVARMMATNHVHSIVVTRRSAGEEERAWGLVSDIDLVRAAADAEERTAGESCATEVVSVDPEETLPRAAQLMAEQETSHLVVVDQRSKEPVGVLSTLDLAGVIAWGRA